MTPGVLVLACGSSNQWAGAHHHAQPERQGGVCLDCVHSQGSVAVLQVTGSLLILILVCCCIVVCLLSYCEFLRVTDLFPEPLIQPVCLVGDYRNYTQ